MNMFEHMLPKSASRGELMSEEDLEKLVKKSSTRIMKSQSSRQGSMASLNKSRDFEAERDQISEDS